MWILLTYKSCSNESENAPDCIDFGLFLKNFPGGACPRTPLDCASAMQMRMSRRLCRHSIDSSTRKSFPLFSQQSVTGYVAHITHYLSDLLSDSSMTRPNCDPQDLLSDFRLVIFRKCILFLVHMYLCPFYAQQSLKFVAEKRILAEMKLKIMENIVSMEKIDKHTFFYEN